MEYNAVAEAEKSGHKRGRQEVESDETWKLSKDLLLTYAGTTGLYPRKDEVRTCVRAARWLMEEWRNPTPDPPEPSFEDM